MRGVFIHSFNLVDKFITNRALNIDGLIISLVAFIAKKGTSKYTYPAAIITRQKAETKKIFRCGKTGNWVTVNNQILVKGERVEKMLIIKSWHHVSGPI